MAITVTFLRDKGQLPDQAARIARQLADFIRAARQSLRLAAYDFTLEDAALAGPVRDALRDRAAAGVDVRLIYYHKKDTFDPHNRGATTVPSGTETFLEGLTDGTRIQLRPVRGDDPRNPTRDHLMHNKYLVRDTQTEAAAVWTGSTNFTDEAWKYMENNIVCLDSPQLADYYANDFDELWSSGEVSSTGAFDVGQVTVGSTPVDVAFTPGQSNAIDRMIVDQLHAARRSVHVAAAQLSTPAILQALVEAAGRVPGFGGIYDGPQVQQTLHNLSEHAETAARQIELLRGVTARLVAKPSRPYQPDGKNNIMHNKVIVCDDTVITGSYNFSRNGALNAENVLLIHDAGTAQQYREYIEGLMQTYSGGDTQQAATGRS